MNSVWVIERRFEITKGQFTNWTPTTTTRFKRKEARFWATAMNSRQNHEGWYYRARRYSADGGR